MLVSARNGGARTLELDHSLPEDRVTRLRLQAPTPRIPGRRPRAATTQPPTTDLAGAVSHLRREPVLALQLAEAIEARGENAPAEGLPIPETLADAMRERLAALTWCQGGAPADRRAGTADGSLLRDAAIDDDGVQEAVRAGVLVVDGSAFGSRTRCSGLSCTATPPMPRDETCTGSSPRSSQTARSTLHLARGTAEPDEIVASTLEAIAGHAATRGHPEVGAELAEHAARLTAAQRPDDRARRVRETARFLLAAGDARSRRCRGTGHAASGLGGARTGAERSRIHGQRHLPLDSAPRTRSRRGRKRTSELRSRILSFLCWKEGMRDPLGRGIGAGPRGRGLAERSGSGAALAASLGRLAWSELGPGRTETIARAEELERSLDEQLPWALSPSFVNGMFLFALDRLDEARRQFEDVYERAVAVGDWFRSIYLAWLAEVELRTGNWERAREHTRGTRSSARRARPSARPGERPPARWSRRIGGTRRTPFEPANTLPAWRARTASTSVSYGASSLSGCCGCRSER